MSELTAEQEDFLLEQSREDKPLKKGCGKQFKKYWNNIDFDYLNCGEHYGINGAFLCKACSRPMSSMKHGVRGDEE